MKTSRTCALCAEVSLTCCQLNPGQEEFCFPLSNPEVAVLERQLPSTDGFFVTMPNSPAFLQALTHLFPFSGEILRRRFPRRSSHQRLATDADGRCAFLGGKGCVLSDEHRPLFCRLFPFWIVGEQLYIFEYERCLQIKTAQSLHEVLAAFGTTLETLGDLYDRLCLAWGLGPDIPRFVPSPIIPEKKIHRLKIPSYSSRQLPAP